MPSYSIYILNALYIAINFVFFILYSFIIYVVVGVASETLANTGSQVKQHWAHYMANYLLGDNFTEEIWKILGFSLGNADAEGICRGLWNSVLMFYFLHLGWLGSLLTLYIFVCQTFLFFLAQHILFNALQLLSQI